jgi:hypothetical protein
MDPTYTDQTFSYLSQTVFLQYEFEMEFFLLRNFCRFSWIKVWKQKQNFFILNPLTERFLLHNDIKSKKITTIFKVPNFSLFCLIETGYISKFHFFDFLLQKKKNSP